MMVVYSVSHTFELAGAVEVIFLFSFSKIEAVSFKISPLLERIV
ncbi:hypothetical protein HBHAL_3226 [Halobacillus halophilus DSM 2266]|uniref:Uncharacterized protein n=1 Tax=Halobacillus halophilus (strain ATCC 35676 / DSM 2266 / JCM 20832 / KCTC 3685 / LMG 17431 / NBRC 102448 / NCIMB 2269) TaxID=866895 RepID=I0JN51_HALH3|nr:hypothetical protein [Halobacillus halophilus]CCG45571.1 hypothetical protein HBHAL_3226 [Halobacillus halophilus DSM 2266]